MEDTHSLPIRMRYGCLPWDPSLTQVFLVSYLEKIDRRISGAHCTLQLNTVWEEVVGNVLKTTRKLINIMKWTSVNEIPHWIKLETKSWLAEWGMSPSRHCWGYYSGTLSCSQVTATIGATSSLPIFKRLYHIIYKTLPLFFSVQLREC